jgi:hypothetical protein
MMPTCDRLTKVGAAIGPDATSALSEIAALKHERALFAEERWAAVFRAGGDDNLAVKFTRGAGLPPGRLDKILARSRAIEARLAELTVVTDTRRNRGAKAA